MFEDYILNFYSIFLLSMDAVSICALVWMLLLNNVHIIYLFVSDIYLFWNLSWPCCLVLNTSYATFHCKSSIEEDQYCFIKIFFLKSEIWRRDSWLFWTKLIYFLRGRMIDFLPWFLFLMKFQSLEGVWTLFNFVSVSSLIWHESQLRNINYCQ